MNKYSRTTHKSILISTLIHTAMLLFFGCSSLFPSNGMIITSTAQSYLLISTSFFCISGIFFVYSLGLFIAKYSKDSLGAGIPFGISVISWLSLIFILPFLFNTLDLRFRLFQNDFKESAKIAVSSLGETKITLPDEYRHISIAGDAYLVQGKAFFMESVGMMAEYGPGYLYDSYDKPEEVCTNFSPVLLVDHWYRCSLNWNLIQ
jgi:hypothetical protein